MQRNLIAAAIGALFVVGAGSAFALTPAATIAVSAANQIRAAGATAQDPGILNIMRRNCGTGTLDTYTYTGSNAQTVYSCTLATPIGGVAAGTSLVVFKDSAVGSQNGVGPFTSGGAGINFVNLTAANFAAACGTPATVAAVAPLVAYNNYTCGSSATVTAAIPDIGFSDVEPASFYPSSQVTGASVETANQMIFGIPVSIALYNYLQSAQGLSVTTAADSANRPSLTSAQIAGLFNTNLFYNTDLGTATIPSLADNQIYIVRRPDTSGTQKATEINFLNSNIVNPAPSAFATADLTAATSTVTTNANYANLVAGCGNGVVAPTAGRVFAGNGSSDVRNCLNQHGANRYAIGLLSMESNEGTAAGWRWVKVNGVMPTVANVIRGTYENWVEQAMLLKNGAAAIPAGFYAGVKADLGNPAYIPGLNGGFTTFTSEAAGQRSTGIVALPNLTTGLFGGACSAKFAGAVTPDSDPVNVQTKSAGGAPNSAVKPGVAVCASRF